MKIKKILLSALGFMLASTIAAVSVNASEIILIERTEEKGKFDNSYTLKNYVNYDYTFEMSLTNFPQIVDSHVVFGNPGEFNGEKLTGEYVVKWNTEEKMYGFASYSWQIKAFDENNKIVFSKEYETQEQLENQIDIVEKDYFKIEKGLLYANCNNIVGKDELPQYVAYVTVEEDKSVEVEDGAGYPEYILKHAVPSKEVEREAINLWNYVYNPLKGDINFDKTLNTLDALDILKSVVKTFDIDDFNAKSGDYNMDGVINTLDSLEILKDLTLK